MKLGFAVEKGRGDYNRLMNLGLTSITDKFGVKGRFFFKEKNGRTEVIFDTKESLKLRTAYTKKRKKNG
jgi:hypothetical protein